MNSIALKGYLSKITGLDLYSGIILLILYHRGWNVKKTRSVDEGHTSLFLTPDGRHAGEMTLWSFSWPMVDPKVTVSSPNLSFTVSTALIAAAFFSRSASPKSDICSPSFSERRKGNAEETHAAAEAYPVEDRDCAAVYFTRVVREDGQSRLFREGLEIGVPDGKGNPPALMPVTPRPPADPFA